MEPVYRRRNCWANNGRNKTVIRGGYARIYGRLNGVDLMLVPLLGPGLLQAVSCVAPTMGGACTGAGGATPANAFRIGWMATMLRCLRLPRLCPSRSTRVSHKRRSELGCGGWVAARSELQAEPFR